MENFLKLAILVCLFFVCGEFHAQTVISPPEKADTFSCSFFFSQDDYTINLELKNNAETIWRMDSVFRYCHEKNIIYSGDIKGFASIDGITGKNLDLSKNRAFAVENYLFQNFPFLEQSWFNIEGLGEDWEDFRNSVLSDKEIPARQQLIDILDDNSLNNDEKKLKIKKLARKTTYNYLAANIFPFLRKADIRIKIDNGKEAVHTQPEIVEKEDTVKPTVAQGEMINSVSQAVTESQLVKAYPARWAVKTNLLYWAADLIFNAGAEVSVGKQWSIDVPVTFSPYTVKQNWRMRTLSIQPELRWWMNRAMTGSFFGLHGHAAYYNISTDKLDRYQDKDGKSPLWGFGLSYGYAFHLKNHWNMEATIGAGYARLNYDDFYNINNGAQYESQTKDYWGITRAAVNLIYLFK